MYAKILLLLMTFVAGLTLIVGIQRDMNSKEINKAGMFAMNDDNKEFEVEKSEEEWQKELTPDQYMVLRQKGTERPWTGKFNEHFEPGTYSCAGCGNELFNSDTKFESHCGWPSFYEVLDKSKVREIRDTSHGMDRTEIVCAKCGGHLGHVFNDGPNPTGLRYCINSVSLEFEGDSTQKESD